MFPASETRQKHILEILPWRPIFNLCFVCDIYNKEPLVTVTADHFYSGCALKISSDFLQGHFLESGFSQLKLKNLSNYYITAVLEAQEQSTYFKHRICLQDV